MIVAGISLVSVIGVGIAGTLYRLGNSVSSMRSEVSAMRSDIHDQGVALAVTDANFLRHVMDHHAGPSGAPPRRR